MSEDDYVPLSCETRKKLRKVDPMREAEEEFDAYVSSLEDEQPKISPDEVHQMSIGQLQQREAQVARDRELRARQAHVRRLEYENAIEDKLNPVVYRLKIVPYAPAVRRALSNAGNRLAPKSRMQKLYHQYGIQPSSKQTKKKKVVLTVE